MLSMGGKKPRKPPDVTAGGRKIEREGDKRGFVSPREKSEKRGDDYK